MKSEKSGHQNPACQHAQFQGTPRRGRSPPKGLRQRVSYESASCTSRTYSDDKKRDPSKKEAEQEGNDNDQSGTSNTRPISRIGRAREVLSAVKLSSSVPRRTQQKLLKTHPTELNEKKEKGSEGLQEKD